MQTSIIDKLKPRASAERCGQCAFTFLELLVVLSVIAALAALLAPAVASGKADSDAAKCMGNHRQIVTAWQMYANENRNFFPPNWNGQGADENPTWCRGWESWYPNTPDNTNWHQLIDSTQPFGSSASLGPYLGKAYQVFKCPADVFECQEGIARYPRVRSLSMNAYIVGVGSPPPCAWSASVCGWRTYAKVSDLSQPSPANLFVTLDEHPDSINDAWFVTGVANTASWEDMPASYHNGAAGISFADGHSELHHWQRAATRAPVLMISANGVWNDTAGNVDIGWVTNHCSDTITGD